MYNSVQRSFLSLAWPWSGRSLPKGNQWEWWDPWQGPLPGLGEVGYSPRGTSGSDGTLDWGPMWSGSQSTCHPNAPNIPYTPWQPLHPLPAPKPPDAPTFLPVGVLWPWNGVQCGWAPSQPTTPMHPDTPYTPTCPTPQFPYSPVSGSAGTLHWGLM